MALEELGVTTVTTERGQVVQAATQKWSTATATIGKWELASTKETGSGTTDLEKREVTKEETLLKETLQK